MQIDRFFIFNDKEGFTYYDKFLDLIKDNNIPSLIARDGYNSCGVQIGNFNIELIKGLYNNGIDNHHSFSEWSSVIDNDPFLNEVTMNMDSLIYGKVRSEKIYVDIIKNGFSIIDKFFICTEYLNMFVENLSELKNNLLWTIRDSSCSIGIVVDGFKIPLLEVTKGHTIAISEFFKNNPSTQSELLDIKNEIAKLL